MNPIGSRTPGTDFSAWNSLPEYVVSFLNQFKSNLGKHLWEQSGSSTLLTDVNMAGCIVPLTDIVKLGVTIDRQLHLTHTKNVCKSSYYHIWALKHIRSSLSTDMAKTVASALVNSRLNYANSVLYNISSVNMLKLQWFENSLARVVIYTKRVEHIHLYVINCTGFRSTTRLRHWRIKYGQWEVQHLASHKWYPLSRPGRLSANRNINAFRTHPCRTPGHRALNWDLRSDLKPSEHVTKAVSKANQILRLNQKDLYIHGYSTNETAFHDFFHGQTAPWVWQCSVASDAEKG